MASEVYFVDMKVKPGVNMLTKLEKLYDKAGFNDLLKANDLVALKVHFGERGNTAYIRPQYIRRIVNKVKEAGAKPFITDANTLYVGSRSNAVDHLQTAIENGFAYSVVDAPLVIADGLNGKDYQTIDINQKHFKDVKIGSAVVHADAIIAISHFKGHMVTGFGGTLKNIGMGLGSRSGKQMMHSDVLPSVDQETCTACQRCEKWCPAQAITFGNENKKASINHDLCIGCGECTVTCHYKAIGINWKTTNDMIQEKIAEYTLGVLKNKQGKSGFISFVTNVTPECDCCGWNEVPIVSDIGILASTDPIALDQACVDLVNRQKGLKGSRLDGQEDVEDKFGTIHKGVDWRVQLEYGERIGLGTRKYQLVQL